MKGLLRVGKANYQLQLPTNGVFYSTPIACTGHASRVVSLSHLTRTDS